MMSGLERLASQTDDPFALLMLIVILALIAVCTTLFRAWTSEIKAHRQTIQDNIRWTRENTALISEVRQTTERFHSLVSHATAIRRWGDDQ